MKTNTSFRLFIHMQLWMPAALLALLSSPSWADPGSVNPQSSATGSGLATQPYQDKPRESINVLDFGAYNDGSHLVETTAAVQRAVDYGISHGTQVTFPRGSYLVTTILIKDACYNFTVHSENAQFCAGATSAQNGIFDIVNCIDFHMTGSYHLNVGDNPNYAAGLSIRAQTGTSHATTRINIYNVTVRNAKIGISVGTHNVDYQCSEINFFGANFFKCPVAVYNGGSQTGASYNGCNITAEPNAAFPGVPEHAILMDGGFVTVAGGEITLSNTPTTQTVSFHPAGSTTYKNPYGILRVSGTHIESVSQLVCVSNPRKLAVPASHSSNITITTAGGWCGANAGDFIAVSDSSYEGYLEVTSCNFYSEAARPGYNISSASPLARIKVDKGSFNRNFGNWFGAVAGGKILHDMQPVVNATGLSVTLGSGESILKFLNNVTTDELARYGGRYSPATGLFTVPSGGFARLEVKVSIAGSAAVGDSIYIKKNGAIVWFGNYQKNGTINGTLWNLAAGDTIGVYVNQTAQNTFDNGIYQSLQISGSTF